MYVYLNNFSLPVLSNSCLGKRKSTTQRQTKLKNSLQHRSKPFDKLRDREKMISKICGICGGNIIIKCQLNKKEAFRTYIRNTSF